MWLVFLHYFLNLLYTVSILISEIIKRLNYSNFQNINCQSRDQKSKWSFILKTFYEVPSYRFDVLHVCCYLQTRTDKKSERARGCWLIPLTRSIRLFVQWMNMIFPQTISVVNLHHLSSPFPPSLPGIVVVALFAFFCRRFVFPSFAFYPFMRCIIHKVQGVHFYGQCPLNVNFPLCGD